jgi:polysaccharide deacetylase family protein (PEP-CTERM system associated)
MTKPSCILSVDVEDYFQTEAFASVIPRVSWGSYKLRVDQNTQVMLDLFDEFNVHATFFVLGWIADRLPMLVREISERGHELACHSYWHRPVYSLNTDSFREDTRNAIRAIEDAAGVQVAGYRAPTWSITQKSLWALDVLAEEGFEYDSSVYPIHHDLYGIPGARTTPYAWKTAHRCLLEIPPTTYSIGKMAIPAAGGGYLRILPLCFSQLAINQITSGGHRAVVYLHPWEIDPEQPRMKGPWKSRLRQYWGLNSLSGRLETLLQRNHFVPFRDALSEVANTAPQIELPTRQLVMAI